MRRKLIIICGATGVGKTDLSLSLAHKLSGDIINADMGQFYKPLTVGTAKPAWQQSDIPHYLFDIIDKPEDFSVIAYRKYVESLFPTLNMPASIVVGGSTFYIHTLFFVQAEQKINNQQSLGVTWHDLQAIDPERAEKIHPHDTYRIQRAWAIWQQTNQKPSSHQPTYNPISSAFTLIILRRDRDDLYERINKRVEVMFQQGWIKEVEGLMNTPWKPFLLRKKIIGYDDIIRYLEQSQPLRDEKKLKELIAQKTRNYAKRQNTFWRMLEKKLAPHIKIDSNNKVHTVNLTDTTINKDLINRLCA